eukprot:231905_1
MQHVKLTVTGDKGVGKTSLLISYTTNAFPSEYIPSTFDEYSANVMLDNRPVQLSLHDTPPHGSGHDYGGTQIFVLCFAINNRESFNSVRDNWLPELTQHRAGIPYILCGTKSDLRNDLTLDTTAFVSAQEANEMKLDIGASEYMEISALTQDNLKSLIDESIRVVLNERLELVINNNANANIVQQRREFKCECDWREVLNESWQVCAFFVALSVYIMIDVWALVVAYQQYKTKDECWNELDTLSLIHPETYLIVGALVSIISVGVGMMFKTLCGVDEERQDVPRLFVLCFFFVWAIIGYVIAAEIRTIPQCHQQSITKMILAWSIVKNVEFCCG